MSQIYHNLIFTTHASQRMNERSSAADKVESVIVSPHTVQKQNAHTSKFIKTINSRKYQVIAQWKAEQQKWLVISVWVRGEDDKEPFAVQLLLLPFRLIWWVIKKLFITR